MQPGVWKRAAFIQKKGREHIINFSYITTWAHHSQCRQLSEKIMTRRRGVKGGKISLLATPGDRLLLLAIARGEKNH